MDKVVEKQIAALRPLTDRLNTAKAATRSANEPKGGKWTNDPLTNKKLVRHLTSNEMWGCGTIKVGESTTRIALLDLDDHNGEMDWADMQAFGEKLRDRLVAVGLMPTMFRSSGGNGIHLIMLWEEPQDAASVRAHLANLIGQLGYTDGAHGLSKKQIEIFPKQDAMAVGDTGNFFWLPFGRESRLIEPAFGLIESNEAAAACLTWEMSAPVPLTIKSLSESDSDDLEAYMRHQPKDFTLVEIHDMLDAYPADSLDHDQWCQVGMALHHQFVGDDEGLEIFDAWSAKDTRTVKDGAPMYTPKGCCDKWKSFGKKTDQAPVTLATIKGNLKDRQQAYMEQLLKTGIVRDLEVFIALESEILSAPDLETLINEIVPKVKGLKGLTADDSERLVHITKKTATKLGQVMRVNDLRPRFKTDEQTAYNAATASAQIQRIVGDRKHVRIVGGNMDKIIDECAQLFDGELFQGGAGLVRPGVNDKDEPELIEINQEWLRREVTSRVAITTMTEKGDKFIDFPEDMARVLLRGAGEGAFLKMDGLAAAPFMRDDGTICSVDGYDPKSRIWLRSTLKQPMPAIADHPTKADAKAALRTLLDLVADFPFVDEVAKAAWVADLLGAIARPGLPTCPGAVYTAPTMGTGKSLLMEITNIIAYGYTSNTNNQKNEEELRKLLTSTLKKGQPFLSFDNFPRGTQVDSSVMAGFLTSPVHQDRLLGSNDAPSFKNRTRITMTGNNIVAAADLARRFLNIPLMVKDTKSERKFAIENIRDYVKEHRGTYLAAALTILRAGHLAKDLPSVKVLASFESWSHRVQKPVVWLGLPDPVESVKRENDGSDEITMALEAVRKLMDKATDHGRFGSRELWREISSQYDHPVLGAMVDANGGLPIDNVLCVGHWLNSVKGMTAGRYHLTALPKKVDNRVMYRFELNSE